MHAAPSHSRIPKGLALGITALNRASLDGDFDDARLCLAQIREQLTGPDLAPLQMATDRLRRVLGPRGTQPGNGLGRALMDVTEALERLSGHRA